MPILESRRLPPAGGNWRFAALSRLDRPLLVGDPVAPRAGVETAPGQSRVRHGEQVVAGRDAGSAIRYGLLSGSIAEESLESLAEPVRGQKATVRVEVLLEGCRDGPRNVSRHGIEGFHLPPVAFSGASIQQRSGRIPEPRGHLGGSGKQLGPRPRR